MLAATLHRREGTLSDAPETLTRLAAEQLALGCRRGTVRSVAALAFAAVRTEPSLTPPTGRTPGHEHR